MNKQDLRKLLIRETNLNKFTYESLKGLFRDVRKSCDIHPTPKGRKLYELPTSEELNAFYSVTPPEHKIIFKCLEGTGLRVSELCNLPLSNIDWANNTIFIKEGKNKVDRKIIMGNKLRELLQLYLVDRNNKYLFESNRHTKYTTRRIQQLVEKYRKLGVIIKKFTVHTFRHLHYSFLAEKKISKEYRAMLAGHSDDKTQAIYTHLGLAGIKEELIQVLDML